MFHGLKIKNGDIVVAPQLNSYTYKMIKNAKALVIDSVFPRSIDEFVYRKNIKIPTIIGTKNAIKILQNGNIITVNGLSGEIYSGGLM